MDTTTDITSALRSRLLHMEVCVELANCSDASDLSAATKDVLAGYDGDKDYFEIAVDAADVLGMEPLYNADGELRYVTLLLACNGPTETLTAKISEDEVIDVTYFHSWGEPQREIHTISSLDDAIVADYLRLLGLEL
jgi:hypothetical protein